MPELETRIWMAIREHIVAAAGDLRVIEPSEVAELDGSPFVAVADIPASAQRLHVASGGPHRYSGVITISYVAPLGRPYAFYKQKAGQIARYFDDGIFASGDGVCVRVSARATVLQGYQDGAYWRTPIRYQWQCAA